MAQYTDFERKGILLYKYNNKYYRLFAKGVTPNGCWLIAPQMRELLDINIATGLDDIGEEIIEFDITGSVPGNTNHIQL